MKRAGTLLFILFLLSGLLRFPSASAQDTQNFIIKSFWTEYYLDRNANHASSVNVVEHIIAQFPDFDQNHGILRAIPEKYQGHTTSLQLQSVRDGDGNNLNYSKSHQNDNLVLKIGDADKFVHGEQTYTVRYQMKNVISFQSTADEFYWDVNGDQWPQQFSEVRADIHVPKSIAANLQNRQVCYSGTPGSSDQSGCEVIRQAEPTGVLLTATTNRALNPYQTLTFAVGFNKGTFVMGPEVAREKRLNDAKRAAAFGLTGLPPIIAFVVMFKRWRQFGDDPKGRGVIIPEYEPPKELDALASDFLLNEQLRPSAISALLIELATKKHLVIYEIPKKGLFGKTDFELELKSLPSQLRPESREVLGAIFGSDLPVSQRLKISDFKKGSRRSDIYEKIQSAQGKLAQNMFEQGYFIKNPSKIRSSYMTWAVLPFVAATAVIWIGLSWLPLVGLGAGLALTAVVMFLFAFIMPARSEKGVLAHDSLLGLKDYIKLAEADRLKFLQSPEGAEKIAQASFDASNPKMQVKLFESLLPYAMLFGLEKQWAKQFADIYKTPPDWYQGNWTAFNSGYLASSVSNFSSASSVSFSPPSSSGGSGFSGGGAGGGGGGGGGGGW